MIPDPLFVVVRALGRQYRVISAAYRPPAPWPTWLPVSAILDAEQVSTVHVVGSSFGGYLAECLVRAPPRAVDSLVLAQSGVRHFVDPVPLAVLHALLRVAPARLVRSFSWRGFAATGRNLGSSKARRAARLHCGRSGGNRRSARLGRPRRTGVNSSTAAGSYRIGTRRSSCPDRSRWWTRSGSRCGGVLFRRATSYASDPNLKPGWS
jgi:pimeloyl-ACP methyl ester carboxylesterase